MCGQMHHYCPIQRLKGHRLTSKHSKVSFCFVTCASENVFTQITNLGGKAVIFSKEFCLRSFFKLRCANEVLVNPLNYISVQCFTICVPNRKMLSIFCKIRGDFSIFAEQCNVGHCSSYKSCVANRVNRSKICSVVVHSMRQICTTEKKTCRPFCPENSVMFCSVSKNVLLPFKFKRG